MNGKDHLAALERCGFFICPPVDEVRPVTIPEGEEYVEILAGGKLFFQTGEKWEEMPLGTVFWHKQGEKTICRTSAKDPYRCYVFHFHVTDADCPSPRVSSWKEAKEVLEFASKCLHTYQNDMYDKTIFARYVYYTLQWHTLMEQTKGTEYPVVLSNALRFMDKNFSFSHLSTSLIAERSGISRPYLFDLFRKFLGESPCQYLLKRRVEEAKRSLMTSSLPIKDIAEQSGFASIEVFYRSFRRITQMTPADYRKKYSIYPGL